MFHVAITTCIESIVDAHATLDEADALAQRVIENLCSRGIILPTQQTHDYLENGPRYATGPNAHLAADNINDVFPCGMDISIGRNVFDTGELAFNLFCPNCKHQFAADAMNGEEPVGRWYESGDVNRLGCSECSSSTSFMDWFHPPFGFGILAFCFSEWFLKQEFVDHISELLEHPVIWVKAQY
ncbi:hypothetical protein [Lignipirellula cremea]|uniref:hypothetical protein n=1 Tax=Lignipirellula cremea TaxID=2528010 RepID=UPI0011A1CB63|nr:hypothetical protein [Lignipirellula cremea]